MADRHRWPQGHSALDLKEGVSLRPLLEVLRRRKWFLIVPAVLVTALAVVVAFLLPPRYRAEAVLVSEPMVARDQVVEMTPLDVQRQVTKITEVLYRRSLLEQIIREHDLSTANGTPISERQLAELRQRISFRIQGDSAFVLGFEDSERERVAAVVARLAALVIERTGADREQRAQATASFIAEQLGPIKAELDEQKRGLESYKEQWFAQLPVQVDTTSKRLEGAQERLQRSSETLIDQQARRAAIVREMAQLEQQGARISPEVARRAELERELRELRMRYRDAHPDVVKALAELEELERGTTSGSAALAPQDLSPARLRYLQLAAELEAVEERVTRGSAEVASLSRQSAEYQARIEAAPRHETVLAAMNEDYEATRIQYQALLAQLQEAQLNERLEKTTEGAIFRVVEAPRVPAAPSAPNRLRLGLLGLLAGLGVGVGAAFLAEQLDSSFRDVDEVEAALDLPVLATIPSLGRKQRRAATHGDSSALLLDEPNGYAAEQYRILATRLIHRGGAREATSVLVTSPMGGEGKTTTAINLALALAQLVDDDVLLLDADLVRPSVQRTLRLPASHGLNELVRDPDRDLDQVARWHRGGIHIIEAGRVAADNRASLASPQAQRLFQRLRHRFPYIVVDAPPILAVAEGLILQQMVSTVLLVTRARVTQRSVARRALLSLDPSRLAGVVVNDLDPASSYEYYYPHYEQSAGAGVAAGGAGR